jgi:hypothetical protein
VLEAVFILLESLSPSRKNFIGSHSLPPSLVHRHGGMGGSSVCPRSSVYGMDELCVLLMPPRGSVSLLGGATSSSIIRGDSET